MDANLETLVNRVTYTGDLGYEIWVRPEFQRRLYAEITRRDRKRTTTHGDAGAAVVCVREELSDGTESYDLCSAGFPCRTLRRPRQGGLHRQAGGDDRAGAGRDTSAADLVVDAEDADVLGDEPIWHDGKVVGWVTSGGYAHWADKSLAMGYVPRELARG